MSADVIHKMYTVLDSTHKFELNIEKNNPER